MHNILFLLGLFLLLNPESAYAQRTDMAVPVIKKVLVLEFNPIIESGGSVRLNSFKNWNNPIQLEQVYINDVRNVSDNILNYQIVERQVIDDFPILNDGYDYTDQSYLACLNNTATCHMPWLVNYLAILNTYDVCGKRNRDEIDEVWLWGAPYFGYWEAVMVGPNAFYTNAPPISGSNCTKQLHVMGFSYERGVPEMIENMGHRIEGTLTYVYGGWRYGYYTPPVPPGTDSNWDRFTVRASHAGWTSLNPGCGNIHLPPNSTLAYGYDWNNNNSVTSNCEDWFNYPNLTGTAQIFNCSRWACDGNQFKKWWMKHLPRYRGLAPDGKLNNWWHYVYDYPEAKVWEACESFTTVGQCDAHSSQCAWYFCAYGFTGGCFPRGTQDERACRAKVYFVSNLKELLRNYLGSADSQYKPQFHEADGKVNMLDGGWVVRWLVN